MLQGEHSAILSTFIKLPFVIKTFVLSIFEWLFMTGFTLFSSAVTLKIRARSLEPNLVFIMPRSYIHANLVPIHPLAHEISCTQESAIPKSSPMGFVPKTDEYDIK